VQSPHLRLILDAHASVAFIAGSALDVKSGVSLELVQKGRVGPRVWRANDGSENGPPTFRITEHKLGDGPEIAVAIVSRSPRKPPHAPIVQHPCRMSAG
jgi:hypothetical protein